MPMNLKKKWDVIMDVQEIVLAAVVVVAWVAQVHVLVVASIVVEVNALWLAVLVVQAVVPLVVEAIINELF